MSDIRAKLKCGGKWLGAARTWMQQNIKGGDRIEWSSSEIVKVRFCDLEELAYEAACAAVEEYKRSCEQYSFNPLHNGKRNAQSDLLQVVMRLTNDNFGEEHERDYRKNYYGFVC